MAEHRDKSRVPGEVEWPGEEERAAADLASLDAGVRFAATGTPPLSLVHSDALAPEVAALLEAIEGLRGTMENFGTVSSTRTGLRGALERLVKSGLRKLVQRHLDQQKEVHEALDRVLDRLTALLAAEREWMDTNAQALVDESLRRARRDAGV